VGDHYQPQLLSMTFSYQAQGIKLHSPQLLSSLLKSILMSHTLSTIKLHLLFK
jgi:hypothetical protein